MLKTTKIEYYLKEEHLFFEVIYNNATSNTELYQKIPNEITF